MDTKEISEVVSTKALLRSGLIFRGQKSGVDCDNVQLHTTEISKIIQSEKDDPEGLCTTCRNYGLEYLHLLECPAAFGDKPKYDKSVSPYRSESPDPKQIQAEEAFRPVVSRDQWFQCFDTRSHFHPECTVCELLVSLLPEDSTGPWRICWVGYGYYKMHDEHKSWGKANDKINWQTQRTPGIVVGPDQSADFADWWRRRRQYGLVLPTRRRDEESTIPRARCLDSQSVDFDAARSWIRACGEQHGDACGGVSQTFGSLRVIDCRTKTVVPAPASCQYIALSYVWGTNHVAASKNLLNGVNVPPLIQDAVTATVRLGYDFLWVDFYCIPQDDALEKERQIHSMDKIYSEAQATIIAACSKNASIGLSGVSSNSRRNSVTATVGQSTLVAIHSMEAESIACSKWSMRGWTYQEGLLSRRRLIFTDTGLFFQCAGGASNKACATESFDVAFGTEGLRIFVNDLCVFPDFNFITRVPAMIWDCLRSYTEKTLSFDSDVLNAFTGILNRFAETSKDFDHIWGIPVYRKKLHIPTFGGLKYLSEYKIPQTYSEQLASSLLWQPAKPPLTAERRADFPTWSWANATGEIEYEDENIRNLDLDISIEIENEDRIRAETYFSRPVEQRPKPAKGLYLDAPVTYIQLEPLVKQDNSFYSVVSFERLDSIEVHHIGLVIPRGWPKGIKPGRFLAIILGASQKTRSSRLTYHLLVVQEKGDHYERAFLLEVNDATLEQRIPEETWAGWKDQACKVLGPDNIPFIWEDHPADLGFEEEKREDWKKAFLIAKHLRVEQQVVYVC